MISLVGWMRMFRFSILDDSLNFTGHTYREFWTIVERFWDKGSFCKRGDGYRN